MEYLDLVDSNDNVIGVDSRDSIYTKGLKNYRVVNIFVFDSSGKILLPKRDSKRKIYPNCYDFSCGEHVISGETYDDCAIRGLKEELNLENVHLVPIKKLTPQDGVSSFMMVYKVVTGEDIIPNKKEGVASFEFLYLEDIKKMISETPEKFKSDFSKVIKILESISF